MQSLKYYFTSFSLISLMLGAFPLSATAAKGFAPWVGYTFQETPCVGRKQGYGPYDYTQRAALAQNLSIVENFHFTPNVENLRKGENGSIPGDIDYTLSAWPNHHRALNAISRFDLDGYKTQKAYPIVPVECYFQRAIAFSPNDSIPYMLYAIYLHKSGRKDLAMAQYETAEALVPNDPQLQYNFALLLVDMGDFERAKNYADILYSNDFPLPGLKRKLQSSDHWDNHATAPE
jgi:tetratricopeptide (TPR) repeat protein